MVNEIEMENGWARICLMIYTLFLLSFLPALFSCFATMCMVLDLFTYFGYIKKNSAFWWILPWLEVIQIDKSVLRRCASALTYHGAQVTLPNAQEILSMNVTSQWWVERTRIRIDAPSREFLHPDGKHCPWCERLCHRHHKWQKKLTSDGKIGEWLHWCRMCCAVSVVQQRTLSLCVLSSFGFPLATV